MVDNKVVNCIPNLDETGFVSVQHRKENEMLKVSVEVALKRYQDSMGGVNHWDQCHEMGAGFASRSHDKKWYKGVFFGICDLMILNSFFA